MYGCIYPTAKKTLNCEILLACINTLSISTASLLQTDLKGTKSLPRYTKLHQHTS